MKNFQVLIILIGFFMILLIWQLTPTYELKHRTIEINCDLIKPNNSAESVHKLRPFDIEIIGALGDSITVITVIILLCLLIFCHFIFKKSGYGVDNYFQQEVSWSAGGLNTITLPSVERN